MRGTVLYALAGLALAAALAVCMALPGLVARSQSDPLQMPTRTARSTPPIVYVPRRRAPDEVVAPRSSAPSFEQEPAAGVSDDAGPASGVAAPRGRRPGEGLARSRRPQASPRGLATKRPAHADRRRGHEPRVAGFAHREGHGPGGEDAFSPPAREK